MNLYSPKKFIEKGYYHVPILVSNLLFVSLYFILAFHQKLATDDFHFLANLNEYGILGGTKLEYNFWSTRYASVFLNQSVLHFWTQNPTTLFIFSIGTLLAFLYSTSLLLKSLLPLFSANEKNQTFSFYPLLNWSVFFVSILFITTIKIDETWFWLCSTCTYLWVIIMLFFSAAWMLNNKTISILSFIGPFALLYIGGASGPLAILAIVSLVLMFLFSNQLSLITNHRKSQFRTKIIVGFTLLTAAFLLLYFGEGNRNREGFFKTISVTQSFLLNFKMTGIILLKRLPTVIPVMIGMGFPLLYVGAMSKSTSSFKKSNFLKFGLAFFLLIFLYQFPITYKTQDVGAYRALFFVSVLSCIAVFMLFYYLGKTVKLSKVFTPLFYISLVIAPVLFAYRLIHQSSVVIEYSNQYEQRMIQLNKAKSTNTKTIAVPALPPSGFLYSAEISIDSSHHTNKHLKRGLALPFSVTKQAFSTEQ